MVLNGTLLALGTLAPLAGAAPSFKSFRIPTANSEPEGITLGSDGNMWFTEAAANQIGRIDLSLPAAHGVSPETQPATFGSHRSIATRSLDY